MAQLDELSKWIERRADGVAPWVARFHLNGTWVSEGGGGNREAELPWLGFAPVNPGIERKYWKKTSCKNSKIVPKFTNYVSLLFRQKFVFGFFVVMCVENQGPNLPQGSWEVLSSEAPKAATDVMKNFNHLSLMKVAFCRPQFFFTSLSCSREKNPGRFLASVYTWRFSRPSRMYLIPWNRCMQAFLTVPLQWYVLLSAGTLRPKVSEVHLHPMGSLGQLGRVNLLVARFVKGECETHEPPKCSDLRKASIYT